MILRKVLQLDVPAGKTPGPVGPIELEHPSGPAVLAGCHLHGLVFFYRRFGQLLPEQQYTAKRFFRRLQQFLYLLLPQGIGLHPVPCQPAQHLDDGIRVLQARLVLQCIHQSVPAAGIDGDGIFSQCQVNGNAPVVDILVEMIFIPYRFRDRILLQPPLDGHFHFHIPFVIGLEQHPFIQSMLRKVPCPAAV